MKKIPNLDVLRFFLASFVVLQHLPKLCKNQNLPYFDGLPILNRGVDSVYVFFVLSGFLIIKSIYEEKSKSFFSIKNFYVRRILRIFPVYYFVMIFGLIFYNLILPLIGIPFEITYSIPVGLAMMVFFLPNVFSIMYEPGGILQVLWSLGIEEQFYLLVAPLMYLLPLKKILKTLIILASIYFIIFHLPALDFLRKYEFMYFFLFFGGIVAILEEKKKLEFFKKSRIFAFTMISLTVLYFFTDLFLFKTLFLKNLFTGIVFTFFVFVLGYGNVGFKIKNKMLNYLGKISYGIYMYHVIVLNFVVFLFLKIQDKIILTDTLVIISINILTFILTFLISHLSFKYYESYFLKLKNKFRR
ncbi:acyltransferase family protein [Aureivirga sp. CE67]|uniref:acyltransferase family protein n=1 Tax=Aureivirga sp. CE67 TaxID=1788983 RepID=UPI0018C9FDC4|nr:acyltransferase [Aureivirga sp. CE67]